MCSTGFHFCKKIEDVLAWYGGTNHRYAVVRHGKHVIHDSTKSVTSSITILREVSKKEILQHVSEMEKARKKFTKENKETIQEVFEMLKSREIHPSGEFDNKGRWYAENSWAISVRSPSNAYPYSEMVACRTKKYVQAVAYEFNCTTKEELLKHV